MLSIIIMSLFSAVWPQFSILKAIVHVRQTTVLALIVAFDSSVNIACMKLWSSPRPEVSFQT